MLFHTLLDHLRSRVQCQAPSRQTALVEVASLQLSLALDLRIRLLELFQALLDGFLLCRLLGQLRLLGETAVHDTFQPLQGRRYRRGLSQRLLLRSGNLPDRVLDHHQCAGLRCAGLLVQLVGRHLVRSGKNLLTTNRFSEVVSARHRLHVHPGILVRVPGGDGHPGNGADGPAPRVPVTDHLPHRVAECPCCLCPLGVLRLPGPGRIDHTPPSQFLTLLGFKGGVLPCRH